MNLSHCVRSMHYHREKGLTLGRQQGKIKATLFFNRKVHATMCRILRCLFPPLDFGLSTIRNPDSNGPGLQLEDQPIHTSRGSDNQELHALSNVF